MAVVVVVVAAPATAADAAKSLMVAAKESTVVSRSVCIAKVLPLESTSTCWTTETVATTSVTTAVACLL